MILQPHAIHQFRNFILKLILLVVPVLFFLLCGGFKTFLFGQAAAAATSSIPAVSTGADIDTDELVDETGVDPKDIELIMNQVRALSLDSCVGGCIFVFYV